MGWKMIRFSRTRQAVLCLLAAGFLAMATPNARAQFGNGPYTPSGYYYYTGTSFDDILLSLAGSEAAVAIGLGKNQGGSIGVWTTAGETADPSDALAYYFPHTPPNNAAWAGSRVFVRVDGGKLAHSSGNPAAYDFEFGFDPAITNAVYTITQPSYLIEPPVLIGSHIEERWATYFPIGGGTFVPPPNSGTGGTGGGGGGGTGGGGGGTGGGGGGGTGTGVPVNNPFIEIDSTISLIHDQVRFAFNIINNDTRQHTVALAFVQHLIPNPLQGPFVFDAPIKLPGQPYLHHEIQLGASQIPAYYTTEVSAVPPGGAAAIDHSIKALLRPTATSSAVGFPDPTPPTRLVVGNALLLNGGNLFSTTVRDYEAIWNYPVNTAQTIDSASFSPTAVALYWDAQPVPPGNSATPTQVITYLGANTSEFDLGYPAALSVNAPQALGLNATTSQPTPNPFTVAAFIQNLTDLAGPQGGAPPSLDIGPVTLNISLPQGLTLSSGDVATKTISSVGPGTEGSVSWSVTADGTATGSLTFTVTAKPTYGVAKTVQRTILVPAPVIIRLPGNDQSAGLFSMVSVPLQTGAATPTQILFPNLTGGAATASAPDLAKWDPTNGTYISVSTLTPAQGYWIRNRLPDNPPSHSNTQLALNPTLYPPVSITAASQGGQPFKAVYPQGWNQIGNPYLYPIPFSEQEVFDPSTLRTYTMEEAADPQNDLILPAIFSYDTSDPTPANWQYVLQPSIGFLMQPFQGYWLYVNKPNLQFLYTGVDTPGASISPTRAAIVAASLSSSLGRGTANNWQLRLTARGASGQDQYNYIGIAPKATDGADAYKYGKPPVINKQLTLDIIHTDWKTGSRYCQDLRSPAPGVKTWNLKVTSVKPNDTVTVAWPGLLNSVPRSTTLTLVDTDTGTHINLRNRSAYNVTTDANGLKQFQIVAETGGAGRVMITSFNVATAGRAASGAVSSVAINYSLNGAAEAHLQIRDGHGRAIRRIEPSTSVSGSQSGGSAVWDLRSDKGITLPSGTYTLELSALNANGDQTRQTRTYVLTR